MAWVRVLLAGDAAVLSNIHPVAVDGTAAGEGVGTEASRNDHQHALGPLVAALDFDQNQATGLVLDVQASAPNGGTEVEGQIYYDSTALDKHPYVWIP